ncbi:uncharacterized protein METZ01_LOCUS95557 [marine metagenome]|uniref:hydroxyisourate hydrolase n=1 Tax=marine metagenome TaxID=408172 RepID=A0A381VT13_9ZZZZ
MDLVQGTPANNIPATLEILTRSDSWEIVGTGRTNDDGRINNLLGESDSISSGTYRLTFDVTSYFESQQSDSFYSSIPIIFNITNTSRHYHIPLLLSRFGYSTYRGS